MPDTILIVDDDIETLRLVGLMLQRQGFEISTAGSGAQALRQIEANGPDLILLDVMMSDMDGFQITRSVRANPGTAHIPILMFTARSQLDAKVQGYEAGADDYLIKPVHPVELVARIKSLLARHHQNAPLPAALEQHGYLVGVTAPKGGMGVSSLVLNVAMHLRQNHRLDLIAAELRPANGSWSTELGIHSTPGLCRLLRLKPVEITAEAVSQELVRTHSGLRLLLASTSISDLPTLEATSQMEAVVQQLGGLAPLCLLDIGSPSLPNFERICAMLQEMIVVTEPYPGTIRRTRLFLNELAGCGFGSDRLLSVVVVNRVRADSQLTIEQVEEQLDTPVQMVFPPAPEQAFQAGLRGLTLTEMQPDSLLSLQFAHMAAGLSQRVKK